MEGSMELLWWTCMIIQYSHKAMSDYFTIFIKRLRVSLAKQNKDPNTLPMAPMVRIKPNSIAVQC